MSVTMTQRPTDAMLEYLIYLAGGRGLDVEIPTERADAMRMIWNLANMDDDELEELMNR